ncbi:uncharacterized protein LOC110030051 [Phalaenopsis equestris]|uniref:uncharacterized protein LOC110030051 n=1 Tax=Phalaenopsis equestris TaxID=78828 RepID=UPI0009E42107|nr:uncharacterized protein LOC110030051 [Phalaenopsis equestris]
MDSPMFNLTKPFVARVLVERDITQVEEEEVWIGSPHKGYWQKVIIEQHPLYCSNCRMFGLSSDNCYILHPELKIDVRQVGKEVVKPQENVPIEKLEENVFVGEGAMAGEGESHGEGMPQVEKAGFEDSFVEEGVGVDVGLVSNLVGGGVCHSDQGKAFLEVAHAALVEEWKIQKSKKKKKAEDITIFSLQLNSRSWSLLANGKPRW